MNTNNIKKYAPKARNQFRDAVIDKLTTLGISIDKKGHLQVADAEIVGESVRYGQFDYPKATLPRREKLAKCAREQGFDVLVERSAYTWFNRLCAIRYMERHGYLDHGFHVLSHPDNPTGFEVLDHVPEVAESLGLDKARLVEMKLSGNQDEDLYRELLLGQCHALHRAMPFLFEAVDDEAELLLPDNLTRTDSILRNLVDDIPPEDWDQVEVIGWLYQFYISEKKDAVIGKVVKSEDIPAATQLFTPNWIVQYLVQNSVGRQWLQTYPDSPLKSKMDYYIEPAEQTLEVLAQLAAITPSSIEPESIKVLDPACGSGHILIEAYNVLKNIYEERGYRGRDIPQLILENNIFGLDIDDRAAQLSGFALMMMARQDDRRIFSREVRLNILSLQESLHLDIAKQWQQLNFHQQSQTGSIGDMFAESSELAHTDRPEYQLLMRTLKLFVNAKTLGSLIQVPHEEEAELKTFLNALYRLEQDGDIQQRAAAKAFIPYIQQAWILAQRYDVVMANPPYMSSKGMNDDLKEFAKNLFPASKSDLFAMFMQHAFYLLKDYGFNAQINMQVWMFLSTFKSLREDILKNKNIISMLHLGARAFEQITGEVVQTTAFIITKEKITDYLPTFIKLTSLNTKEKPTSFFKHEFHYHQYTQNDFLKIPSHPICYWLTPNILAGFKDWDSIFDYAKCLSGIITKGTDEFIRLIHEVNKNSINKSLSNTSEIVGDKKWVPLIHQINNLSYYGESSCLVNYENNGERYSKPSNGSLRNKEYYFKECIAWADVSSGNYSFSKFSPGCIANSTSHFMILKDNKYANLVLSFLNSNYAKYVFNIINPSIHLNPGEVASLPIPKNAREHDWSHTNKILTLKEEMSTFYENSSIFNIKKIINGKGILKECLKLIEERILMMEQEINSLIEANEERICKLVGMTYSQSSTTTDNTFIKEINIRLVSIIIACIMGRYSLDREGLVYAHEGNQGFADLVAEGAYKTFPADNDGILPLMDDAWFNDDVTTRVKEFVLAVWGEEYLQENLEFIAESLCLYAIKPKKGESALDTIRRYLSTQFWKDHLKMYKKRPIYWLFSSGKEKAFECLVYLHRYNDATLARMRTEYVVPLLARYQANIDRLNEQIDTSSGGEATRLKRERDSLSKKFNELRSFDDRLRHYADMRITLDLDDGVKVNYGKFGDLLADVKSITGNAPEII